MIHIQLLALDVSLSRDLTNQFKEQMVQSHDDMEIDFSIMVLGASFWPLSAPDSKFNIPMDILPIYHHFSQYYQTRHSRKELTWLWNYSKNELRMNMNHLNQKYILMTSSYQMAVLLQYNNNDTLSLDELATCTAISKDVLTQVLATLVKANILINEGKDWYNLNHSRFFLLLLVWLATQLGSADFKSEKIQINLDLPIKAESADFLRTIDEDRNYLIQATIIRYNVHIQPGLLITYHQDSIMKIHKMMKGDALIQEVVSQISQRFVPKMPSITKVCETLGVPVWVGPDRYFRPLALSWRKGILSKWMVP